MTVSYSPANKVFVQSSDSASIDAFARSRVSEPVTLFDSQQQYDTNPLLYVTKTTGTASETHNPDNSGVDLTTGTTATDAIIRQTRQYFRYQPGKSQFVLCTFTFNEDNDNVRRRLGYFDGNNGIFLERYNGVTNIVLRSKSSGTVVETRVAQSDWNIDKLDGTGETKRTLDITKAQIFCLDIEWLGVGRARCGFVIDGLPVYVHEFLHANVGTGAYMTTANLPVRYEIENVDGGTGGDMTMICCSVIAEGGFESERGVPHCQSTGTTLKPVATVAAVPLLSIQPAATFNSIENRSTVVLKQFSGYAEDNAIALEVLYNPTLTGAAFSAVSSADSTVEFDTAATDVSGGIPIQIEYLPAASQGSRQTPGNIALGLSQRLPIGLDVDGADPTVITIVGKRLIGTAGSANVAVSLLWDEIR